MKSVTLTIRLDLCSVISAGEFIKNNQIGNPAEKPISTTVRNVFESMMLLLEAQGNIQPYSTMDVNQLEKIYEDMFNTKMTDGLPGFSGSDLATLMKGRGKPATAGSLEQLGDVVEQQILSSAEPNIEIDTQRTETVEPLKVKKFNILEVVRKPFDELYEMNPKDPRIMSLKEQVEKETVDPIYLCAVEIVYTIQRPESWGTELARNQIDEYINLHDYDGQPQNSSD